MIIILTSSTIAISCSADNQLNHPIRAQSAVNWHSSPPIVTLTFFGVQLAVIKPQCDQINYLICNSWNHPIVCRGLSSRDTSIAKEGIFQLKPVERPSLIKARCVQLSWELIRISINVLVTHPRSSNIDLELEVSWSRFADILSNSDLDAPHPAVNQNP